MNNLVESIMADDLLSASKIVEDRLADIMERKLYEKKRMMQAEAHGKYGHYMDKSDWAEYRKKHPSLGAYDTPTEKGKKPESGLEQRKRLGFVRASKVYDDPRSRRKLKEGLSMIPKEKEAEAMQAAQAAQQQAAEKVSKTPRQMNIDTRPKAVRKKEEKKKTAPKSPGILKRNLNTLMGREPGYVDKRTPEEKDMQRGGWGGKAVRKGAGIVAGAAGRVAGELASYSNLEE